MPKYTTLEDLLNFMPTKVNSDADTGILQMALDWAEGTFETITTSKYDQQVMTNEEPLSAWVSRNGEVVLSAKTRGPVTAVSAVSYRVPGTTNWQSLSWNASTDIVLPVVSDPPEPDSWTVKLFPTGFTYYSVAVGDVWWRWTYTGGYAVVPESMKFVLYRLAQWKYKLREAPLGRVNSDMFGTREIIPALPSDLKFDLYRWMRVVTG